MADEEISDLTEGTVLADADEFVFVDKSDTTMSADGTTKRTLWSTIKAALAAIFVPLTRTIGGVSLTADRSLADLGLSWKQIYRGTITNAASFIQTGLGGYLLIRVTGHAVPATDNVSFNMHVSTNGGSTWDTASNYRQASVLDYSGGVAGYNATAGYLLILNVVDNASGDGVSFKMDITDLGSAKRCRFIIFGSGARDGGGEQSLTTGVTHLGTAARDALRIMFDSGNIASGHILIEGLS